MVMKIETTISWDTVLATLSFGFSTPCTVTLQRSLSQPRRWECKNLLPEPRTSTQWLLCSNLLLHHWKINVCCQRIWPQSSKQSSLFSTSRFISRISKPCVMVNIRWIKWICHRDPRPTTPTQRTHRAVSEWGRKNPVLTRKTKIRTAIHMKKATLLAFPSLNPRMRRVW